MNERLQDKTILVTGAGSGIGRAVALRLVAEGATVLGVGRSLEKLRETGRGGPAPHRFQAYAADLTDPDQISALVAGLTAGGCSRLDGLVNNAGVYRPGRVADTSLADFELTMAANLRAPLWLLREALPLLRQARGASVLNISSTLAYQPGRGAIVYAMSKAALLMLTRCAALELAPEGIRCNAISPGVVETPIFETVMPSAAVAGFLTDMAGHHPLGRVGRGEDIAAAAAYLLSDEAPWVTGVNLPVDGGISLG